MNQFDETVRTFVADGGCGSGRETGEIHELHPFDEGLSSVIEGSHWSSGPYRVNLWLEIKVGEVPQLKAGCTCPVSGWCKHVDAVARCWVAECDEHRDEASRRLEGVTQSEALDLLRTINSKLTQQEWDRLTQEEPGW